MSDPKDLTITIKDAADAVGVSDETLCRACRAGMPHVRHGREFKVRLSEVRAWRARSTSLIGPMTTEAVTSEELLAEIEATS